MSTVVSEANGSAETRNAQVEWLRFRGAARWFWIAFVVAAFSLPLYVGLGNTDYQNDEAGHAFSVDVMLKDGDWLTPKSLPSETVAFLEKPPLKFWIVAAPIRLGLFQNNEFGQRFWDALFAGIAFVYVFLVGRALGGPVCGLASVLLLFVHRPLVFDHGLRGNNMESVLVLAYCAAAYHYLAWRRAASPGRRLRQLIAIAVYFVAAFMCKFVAALFLPMVLVAAALLDRDDRRRLLRDWRACLIAAAVAIGLIAPWFLYQYHQFGREVWDTMFGAHVYTRLTRFLDPAHVRPWHYYFTEIYSQFRLSGGVAAVLGGLLVMVARAVKARWPEGRLVLLWAFLPLGIISLGSSKLYHYAYPFLPPLAIAGGYMASVAWNAVETLLKLPAAALDARVGEPFRARLRDRTWRRRILLGLGGAATLLLLATAVFNGVRISVAGTKLFSNGSLWRPALIAFVAFIAAGRLVTVARFAVPLLVIWLVLPIGMYRHIVEDEGLQNHPLQTVRACMDRVTADGHKPGVYFDGPWLHPFFYYLRNLGPYLERANGPNETLYASLFVPGRIQPVLTTWKRLGVLATAMQVEGAELPATVASRYHVDPSVVRRNVKSERLGLVRFPWDYVMVLPAPYDVCGVEPASLGGM